LIFAVALVLSTGDLLGDTSLQPDLYTEFTLLTLINPLQQNRPGKAKSVVMQETGLEWAAEGRALGMG
jgi:hypothetical protein